VNLGWACITAQIPGGVVAVPDDLARMLAPATTLLFEWTDYWLVAEGADEVLVGGHAAPAVGNAVFRVWFENRLGLTTIEGRRAGRAIGEPLRAEVVSRKFADPYRHVAFSSGLLDDLFARAARLPFAVAEPTGRGVVETLRPPSPLFAFHFLLQHGAALREAVATIVARPHRTLADDPALVPLARAAEIDADVLIDVLRGAHEWQPARGFPLATRLGGRAPSHVRQRLPVETLDTPENRFVLACLRAILTAAEALPREGWWKDVSADRRRAIADVIDLLRRTVAAPLFAEVGRMERVPAASRVLQRRGGYRELTLLWQRFQHARRPLFERLREAMDLRDIALLYEIWAYFALAEEIGAAVGHPPAIALRLSDQTGLHWDATARFGPAGSLVYNRAERSFSGLRMRPDFTWHAADDSTVAFDAKFRLDHAAFAPDAPDDAEVPVATAKRDDLYRMHAYRDGLRVRAAVCVYPGDVAVFWDVRRVEHPLDLRAVLLGGAHGVGAMAMQPDGTPENRHA